jgi:hypothetical protein
MDRGSELHGGRRHEDDPGNRWRCCTSAARNTRETVVSVATSRDLDLRDDDETVPGKTAGGRQMPQVGTPHSCPAVQRRISRPLASPALLASKAGDPQRELVWIIHLLQAVQDQVCSNQAIATTARSPPALATGVLQGLGDCAPASPPAVAAAPSAPRPRASGLGEWRHPPALRRSVGR